MWFKSCLLFTIFFINLKNTLAIIKIYDANSTLVDEIDYRRLQFFPLEEVRGYLWKSNPYNGCTHIDPPPQNNSEIDWILLMHMEDCHFSTKIRNAYNAGYSALILFRSLNFTEGVAASAFQETVLEELLDVPPEDPSDLDFFIPAVKVSAQDGLRMSLLYVYNPKELYLVDMDSISDNLLDYIYAVFGIFFFVFFIVIITLIVRYCNLRAKRLSNRLPSRNLKHLTVKKFKKGDQYEVCAICLEEYNDGDTLRILPCQHAYHVICVDPWLTKNKRVCPVCKRKISRKGALSESETDSESETPTETTLLVNNPSLEESRMQTLWNRMSSFLHQRRSSSSSHLEEPSTSHQSYGVHPPLVQPSINNDYGAVSNRRPTNEAHPVLAARMGVSRSNESSDESSTEGESPTPVVLPSNYDFSQRHNLSI